MKMSIALTIAALVAPEAMGATRTSRFNQNDLRPINGRNIYVGGMAGLGSSTSTASVVGFQVGGFVNENLGAGAYYHYSPFLHSVGADINFLPPMKKGFFVGAKMGALLSNSASISITNNQVQTQDDTQAFFQAGPKVGYDYDFGGREFRGLTLGGEASYLFSEMNMLNMAATVKYWF